MKYLHRQGNCCITAKPRLSAFLLSEAIISLLVLSLTLSLAMVGVQYYQQQKHQLTRSPSDWTVAMLQLEKITQTATLIEVTAKSAKFVTGADYAYPNKVYRLSIYNNMLRLTGESAGHMPIFVNQGYIVLKRQQSTLQIIIIDSIQRKWEYYLDFKGPPRSVRHNSHRTVIKP